MAKLSRSNPQEPQSHRKVQKQEKPSGAISFMHPCMPIFSLLCLELMSSSVAVFDILAPAPGAGAKESKPFALLQPTPKLTELFPNLHVASMKPAMPDGSAFVGLTQES